MDFDEEEYGEKSDQPDEDREDKNNKEDTFKPSRNRKSRKFNSLQKETKSSRSRSRSRSTRRKTPTSKAQKSWKSANAWLNFMQHFRENLRGHHTIKNSSIFRLASKQWSEMSPDEKQPYIDAANKAKLKKKLEKEFDEESRGSSRKRTRPKKSKPLPKRKMDYKYRMSDSEYDSGEDDSMKNYESDCGSVDTDGSA